MNYDRIAIQRAGRKEFAASFRANLIPSIVDGFKWQTRRPVDVDTLAVRVPELVRSDYPMLSTAFVEPGTHQAKLNRHGAVSVVGSTRDMFGLKPGEFDWVCPYGGPGDALRIHEPHWYRAETGLIYYEADRHIAMDPSFFPGLKDIPPADPVAMFNVDMAGNGWQLLAPVMLPDWAVRHYVVIEARTMERLQSISYEDIEAEGCPHHLSGTDRLDWFVDVWDSCYDEPGKRYADDPWVWVIKFRYPILTPQAVAA